MFRAPAKNRGGTVPGVFFSREKETGVERRCPVFLNVLALSSGGEGLGFGNDGSGTKNAWNSCRRSFRLPSEQGGDPINQLEMEPAPSLIHSL